MGIELGDEVVDTVSGFAGVAVSSHSYLNGCTRFSVQPKIDKDGKLPQCESFDAPQLAVTKAKAAPLGDQRIGGPEKYMPAARSEPKR